MCKNKSYITFVIDPPLMMAQSRAESTRAIYNYGQYINQFPPNTIKVIRQYERIQKKICGQKMSMFNEICIIYYVCVYETFKSGCSDIKNRKKHAEVKHALLLIRVIHLWIYQTVFQNWECKFYCYYLLSKTEYVNHVKWHKLQTQKKNL